MSGSPELLAEELLYEIEQQIAAHPRSLQKRIGPSEIGVPCARQLAYKLAGVEPARPDEHLWRATVGTAIHAWLEKALEASNVRWRAECGEDRWLTEGRVSVGSIGGVEITGSSDVYDTVTQAVIDWKTMGPTKAREVKKNGPGETYRVQAHLYGRGWAAAGYPVDEVHLLFLPRNGTLKDALHWHEPYDEQVALEALRRASRIDALLKVFGPGAFTLWNSEIVHDFPMLVEVVGDVDGPVIPTDPHDCRHCNWLRPGSTDLATSCPGDATRVAESQAKAAELSQTADVFG